MLLTKGIIVIEIITTKSDVHLVGNGSTEFCKGKIAEFIIGSDGKGNAVGCFGYKAPISEWVRLPFDNFHSDWEKVFTETGDLTIADITDGWRPCGDQFGIENINGIPHGVFVSAHTDRISKIKQHHIDIVQCIDIIDYAIGKPAICIIFTASKEVFHDIHREN